VIIQVVGTICGVLAVVTGENAAVKLLGLAMITLSLWLAHKQQN